MEVLVDIQFFERRQKVMHCLDISDIAGNPVVVHLQGTFLPK